VFQFLFKFPQAAFARGQLIFLSSWPSWVLWLACAAAAAGLAALIVWQLPPGASRSHRTRAAVIWLLQSALVMLVLVLLWQPALSVSELKSQQNIVAFLIDDSRSMGIQEDGASREARASAALQSGVLDAIARRFQIRLYRLDRGIGRIARLDELRPMGLRPI
jgi:hypothetical protein